MNGRSVKRYRVTSIELNVGGQRRYLFANIDLFWARFTKKRRSKEHSQQCNWLTVWESEASGRIIKGLSDELNGLIICVSLEKSYALDFTEGLVAGRYS